VGLTGAKDDDGVGRRSKGSKAKRTSLLCVVVARGSKEEGEHGGMVMVCVCVCLVWVSSRGHPLSLESSPAGARQIIAHKSPA